MLLVARTPEKLEETKATIEEAGGTAHIHQCDLSNIEASGWRARCSSSTGVDVLVNNALPLDPPLGVELYERFHDFERTMQLNYFGALRLISSLGCQRCASLGVTKGRLDQRRLIGVQTYTLAFLPTSHPRPRSTPGRAASPARWSTTAYITTIYMLCEARR